MEIKKEQLEAINHRYGNALVSASAGSGKTFVMIQRIISLIAQRKADINQILCVTFTDMAAREMKEKMRKAFAEKVADGQTFLAEQLMDIATADVSTLHSFCSKLIRIYFYSLGISPDFKVLEEKTAQEYKNQAIQTTFKKFYDKKEDWFLKLVKRYREKRKDLSLKEKIIKASEFLMSEEDTDKFLEKSINVYSQGNFKKVLTDYKKIIDGKLERMANHLKETERVFALENHEVGSKFSRELLDAVNSVRAEKDVYEIKKYASFGKDMFRKAVPANLESAKRTLANVKSQFVSLIKRVNSFLASREEDEKNFYSLKGDTEKFITVLKAYQEEYQNIKIEENSLDFNDLERYALKLLEDQNVLEEIKSKYKYIFIDEYQDVNSVQEKILSKISTDNLFMVGDVKQSIYGFRGSLPEIFTDKLKNMKLRGEKTVALNHNFRSAQNVLDAVNSIFSYSMTKEYYGSDYLNESMLISGGKYPAEKTGRAEVHFLQGGTKRNTEEEKPRIYDVSKEYGENKKENENLTALLIGEIIRKELTKTYFDVSSGKELPVKYGDIVLLTRNRDNSYVSGIITGLDRQGIPTSSEVKHNVCEFGEVKLLTHVLNLIDCFKQDVALVAVMKSPVGNFTEEELATIVAYYFDAQKRRAKNFYLAVDYYVESVKDELAQKIKDFYSYFSELRFIADFKGAYGALDKVISDCGYENVLLASRLGEQKVKRVRKFLAESKNSGVSYTVKEFLRKVKLSPKSFELSISAKENAVRVMTIHASKGLEFPVVIVCGLEKAEKLDNVKEDIAKDREYGFSLLSYDDERKTKSSTLIRGILAEKTIEQTMKEELRLFYVATTRAKYSLHLTFVAKKDERSDEFTGAERYVNYVPKSLPVSVWQEELLAFSALTDKKRKVLIGKCERETIDKIQKRVGFDYPNSVDVTLPLKTSVTKANKTEIEPVFVVDDAVDKTDNERGNVAHKILEHIDFSSTQSNLEQIKLMIEKGIITNEEIHKINLEKVLSSLNCEVFDEIKNMQTFREKVFLVNAPAKLVTDIDTDENVLLQGVIDLLCIDGEKAIIIDYKYSKASKETLIKRYSKQLELYSYAVEKVLKKNVERKVIVNVLSGEQVEIL